MRTVPDVSVNAQTLWQNKLASDDPAMGLPPEDTPLVSTMEMQMSVNEKPRVVIFIGPGQRYQNVNGTFFTLVGDRFDWPLLETDHP